MNDTRMFAFESDFVASLKCIPMAVRLKLDRCGIKLTLRQWSRFTRQDRQDLLLRPCAAPQERRAYREALVALVALRTGDDARPLPAPVAEAWEDPRSIPTAVRAQARSLGLAPPGDTEWVALSALQRFTLIKLSRDSHDNVNFAPAMAEFGLVPAAAAVG